MLKRLKPTRRGAGAPDLRFAIAALAIGCQAQITTLEIEESAAATIPGATLLEVLAGDLGLDGLSEIDVTTSEEFVNQGAEPGDVRDVMIASFTFTATSPADADLSFIDSIEIHVEAPGLPQQRVAFIDGIPEGTSMVELELEDVDLTDYTVSESMTLSATASGQRPHDDTEVRADVVIAVGVTAQGACNYVTSGGDSE